MGCSVVVMLLCFAFSFWTLERSEQNELTFGDSFYFAIITLTTVGFGDISATTESEMVFSIVAEVFASSRLAVDSTWIQKFLPVPYLRLNSVCLIGCWYCNIFRSDGHNCSHRKQR